MRLPERYVNVKYTDADKKLRTHLEGTAKHRRGLYIHGPVGSGKTHLLYALGLGAEEKLKLRDVLFYNTTELMQSVRDDFGRAPADKERLLERILESKGLLLLDDIGAERLTDWTLEQFYLLINKRYENRLPILFSSNLSVQELAEQLGDRIVSRIIETCDIVNLEGADRRLAKAHRITL